MKEKQKNYTVICFILLSLSALSLQRLIYAASKNDKYGFIDKAGKVVIEPRFDKAFPFSEGLAAVSINNKWSYINKDGKFVVDLQFDWVIDFSEGRAMVCVEDEKFPYGLRCGCVNKEGKIIKELSTAFCDTPCIRGIHPFLDYHSKGSGSGDWGYRDENDKIVIAPQFENADIFSEGLAMVCNAVDKCGFIDEAGKMVIEPQYYESCGFFGSQFQDGLAIVATPSGGGKCGVIDRKGNWVVEPTFKYIVPYSEDLAAVSIPDTHNDLYPKWGFIDRKGNMVIESKFDSVESFHEGLASFKDNNKWGFIDKTGTIIIPAQFDHVGYFKEELAPVKKGEKRGFIDKTGKIVIDFQFDFVSNFDEGLALFGPRLPKRHF